MLPECHISWETISIVRNKSKLPIRSFCTLNHFAYSPSAGYGEGSSCIHLCCPYSSCNDSGALLLWSQCCFTNGTTKGVQSEETFGLPLRYLVAGVHGIYNCISTFLAIVPGFPPLKANALIWYICYQTLLCGLVGLPPSNGVLPQSPMHTKSLAVLKRQVEQNERISRICPPSFSNWGNLDV